MNKKISIIIPTYNEQESLPFLHEKLNEIMGQMPKYDFEILFVNDGSKDKSLEIIKKFREEDGRYNYIDFSRNFGQEIAMAAGLDYVTGDCAIFMDADLQDPPELIPELVKHWEEGYDDVYARRRKRTGEGFVKKFTSKMYYKTRDGVALDVQLGRERPFEIAHVVVTDMPRIGTRMDRDALGAETLDVQRGADHVGQIAAPRIAHHGDLIDVNA